MVINRPDGSGNPDGVMWLWLYDQTVNLTHAGDVGCCRRVMWSQIRIPRILQLHLLYVSRIILTATNGMLFDLHLVFLHMCSPWANIWHSGFDNQAAFFLFVLFFSLITRAFLFCFVFNFGNLRAGHKTALFPEFRLNNWWRHKTFMSLKIKLLKRSHGNQCLWLEQAWCCVT